MGDLLPIILLGCGCLYAYFAWLTFRRFYENHAARWTLGYFAGGVLVAVFFGVLVGPSIHRERYKSRTRPSVKAAHKVASIITNTDEGRPKRPRRKKR